MVEIRLGFVGSLCRGCGAPVDLEGPTALGTLNLNTPERQFTGGGGEGEDDDEDSRERQSSSSESSPISCRLKLRGMGDDGGDSAT